MAARGSVVMEDRIVPARAPFSVTMRAGDHLRIVDLDGRQAVDFLCFGQSRHAGQLERYHAANTIKIPRQILIGKGSVLYSQFARPMMTVVADTVGGHDTIFGCCSYAVDRVRYGQVNPACCQENFERELARHGIGPEHVVANVNWFMSVPVGPDGRAEIAESASRAGDHVELRAEIDLIAVGSNCPEALNAATGGHPSPVRIVHLRP